MGIYNRLIILCFVSLPILTIGYGTNKQNIIKSDTINLYEDDDYDDTLAARAKEIIQLGYKVPDDKLFRRRVKEVFGYEITEKDKKEGVIYLELLPPQILAEMLTSHHRNHAFLARRKRIRDGEGHHRDHHHQRPRGHHHRHLPVPDGPHQRESQAGEGGHGLDHHGSTQQVGDRLREQLQDAENPYFPGVSLPRYSVTL